MGVNWAFGQGEEKVVVGKSCKCVERGGGRSKKKTTTICGKSAVVRAKGVVKVWMSAKRKRKKGMCGKGVGVVSGRFMLSCPCIIVSGS